MGQLRNLRHEKAVRAYVRLHIEGETSGFQYRAYREAYPHHEPGSQCLYSAASRLFKRPEIRKRINEVTKRLITRMEITEERILTQYQEAYDLAKQQGKSADMVSASTAQAKLVGLLRDRIEAGAPGDFDRMESVSDILEEVQRQAGSEAALMLANALGLQPESQEGAASEADAAELEGLEPPSGAVN